jgi:hypothetical protein
VAAAPVKVAFERNKKRDGKELRSIATIAKLVLVVVMSACLVYFGEAVYGAGRRVAVTDGESRIGASLDQLEEALRGKAWSQDPIRFKDRIQESFERMEKYFSCFEMVKRMPGNPGTTVLAEKYGIDLVAAEPPDISVMRRVIEISKELAKAQPEMSEFYGRRLGGLLHVAQHCYSGMARRELSDAERDLIDWDSGALTSAVYFRSAQRTYEEVVGPALKWQNVFFEDLNNSMQQMEQDYVQCLRYIHDARNIGIVNELHSDQLDQAGVALMERYLGQGISLRGKSCVILAGAIERVSEGAPYGQSAAWMVQAKTKLIGRIEDVIRKELVPRRRFKEMLALVGSVAEGYPRSVDAPFRARLLAYMAQCHYALEDPALTARYFNLANTLIPGILTVQALKDLKAFLAR